MDQEDLLLESPLEPDEVRLRITFHSTQLQGSRLRQEDFLITRNVEQGAIAIIADGLGGHVHGDEAAYLGASTVKTLVEDATTWPTEKMADALRSAFARADELVSGLPRVWGWGPPATTLIAACFALAKRRFYAAYVGDSLCYRFRGSQLERLFKPQVDDWGGLRFSVGYDLGVKNCAVLTLDPPLVLEPKDRFLLASDGLCVLDLEEISAHMALPTAREVTEAMVMQILSKRLPDQDNTSLIILDIDEVGSPLGVSYG
jgi:serine/threonine protein phosphatase PrpC